MASIDDLLASAQHAQPAASGSSPSPAATPTPGSIDHLLATAQTPATTPAKPIVNTPSPFGSFGPQPTPLFQPASVFQSSKMTGSTPQGGPDKSPAANTTAGVITNTIRGLPAAAATAGKYVYNQAIQTVLPGITKEEADSPSFLFKQVAPEIAPSVVKIGTDIMQHPVVSAAQIGQGTIKGALNFMANAMVNYIPGLVPKDEKAGTLKALDETFQNALFPEGEGDLGKGFETAGNVAPAMLASEFAAGAAGTAGLGEFGKFAAGTSGFVAAGQSQLPSDATIQERARNALDSLVQQGLFTAGSYGYHLAEGIIKQGAVNAYHAAASAPEDAAPAVQPPTPEVVAEHLATGKTPNQVAYELSQRMPVEDAQKLVAEAQALPASKAPPTASEPAQLQPEAPSALDKTPADFQAEFTKAREDHTTALQAARDDVSKLQTQIDEAKPQSKEKQDLKVQLSAAKEKLTTLQQAYTDRTTATASDLRQAVSDHLTKSGVADEHVNDLVSRVADHITNPELVRDHALKPVRQITEELAAEHKANAPAVEKLEPTPEPKQATMPADKLISHEGAPDTARVAQYKADIQAGKPVKPLKVIKEGDKFGIEDGKHRFQAYQELGIKDVPVEEVKPRSVAKKAPLLPAESTGDTVKSRLASRVETNAIEKKLTGTLGDLPEYNRVNMKEQAQLASDLIATDKDRAIRIARGEEEPPRHILPESVFVAVEDHAVKTGDVELLRQLATGSRSTEATAMGQRIRALGERDQDSPVKAIRDVQQAREKSVEKRTGKTVDKAKADTIKEMKSEIKGNASKRPDWQSFIEEIKCNY